jgi:hypothetical protein
LSGSWYFVLLEIERFLTRVQTPYEPIPCRLNRATKFQANTGSMIDAENVEFIITLWDIEDLYPSNPVSWIDQGRVEHRYRLEIQILLKCLVRHILYTIQVYHTKLGLNAIGPATWSRSHIR